MKNSFMTKKYFSMLAGGTLTCMVTSVLVMLDTIIAGLYLGEKAVEGVSLVVPMYSLANFFATLFSLGIPILYSNAMGEFERERANRVFGFGLLSAIAVGTVMFVLTFFLKDHYLAFYAVDASIASYASDYLVWTPFIFLFLPVQNLIFAMIFADGDETLSVIANITEFSGKLLFSLLLVRKVGAAGIALGALLSVTLSTLVCFIHFFRKKNSLKLSLHFSWELLFDSIHYGITDSGIWFYMAISLAALSKYATVRFGSDALIIVSVINLVWELQLFFDGIGETITPMISVYYSEECYKGVRRIWDLARKTALIEGFGLGIICCVFAGYLPMFLGIAELKTGGFAVTGFRIMSVSMPGVGFIYLLCSVYLVFGRIRFNMITNALQFFILALPLAVIFGSIFGEYGMFIGIAAAPYLTVLVMYGYIRFRYKKGAWPLLINEKEKYVKSYLFEVIMVPEQIISIRDRIEEILLGSGFEKESVMRVMLLFEELYIYIYEENKAGSINAECALMVFDEKIRLVSRDDGRELGISDENMKIDSLRGYIISRLLSQRSSFSKHLITMSFNRNMFEIQMS